MDNNNSKSSSKNIKQLLKELSDLHKQFDSIDIEKTMNSNDSNSLENSDLIKNEITDSVAEIKVIKSNSETDLLSSKPEEIKPVDLIIKKDNIIGNIEKQVDKIRTVQLEINKETPENDIKTSEIPTINLTNSNNDDDDNDNLNESYLSIKDKLEKIKSEINDTEKNYDKDSLNSINVNKTKESELTVAIKEKKIVNKTKNIDVKTSNEVKFKKQLSESELLDRKKSNTLTIIILVLVIVILLSVYFYFFR